MSKRRRKIPVFLLMKLFIGCVAVLVRIITVEQKRHGLYRPQEGTN